MNVRIITKYGDLLKEYYASGSVEIPMVGDNITCHGEQYTVVNRTMDVDSYNYIIEVWKVVEVENELA